MATPLPRRRLATRVLWITVALVVLSEALVIVSSLAQQRRTWLKLHAQEADRIASLLREAPSLATDSSLRSILLGISRAREISLRNAQGTELLRLDETRSLPANSQASNDGTPRDSDPPNSEWTVAARKVDLSQETLLWGAACAFMTLFDPSDQPIELVARSAFLPDAKLRLLISGSNLRAEMRQFAWRAAQLSLLLVLGAGALMYFALHRFLVRPMRRLTDAIVAFRADPEYYFPVDPSVSFPGGNEIAVAAKELAGMQRDLRTALWRKARLAALGAAFSRACHDLRGALSVAMLATEQLSADAASRSDRSAEALITAVEQANALVSRTLDLMREDAPEIIRERFAPYDLIQEGAAQIALLAPLCTVSNAVPKDLFVSADRLQLSRVFGNLLRNAAEAGAKSIVVSARRLAHATEFAVRDNGPGLPETVRATLFQPFASPRRGGTGLGLAIARELMRAHGGELALESTGPSGTCFLLTLPD